MTEPSTEIGARVRTIVASALDVAPERVVRHASLINDLNAESIDFIDIVFRLETEFGIEIPQEDIWKGSIDATDDRAIQAGVERLKAAMPEFRWESMPATITRAELPALITVQTITDYLTRRLEGGSTA
jgi:acyl carrier protein